MLGPESGFEQVIYYVGPIVQLLFWVVMAVCALWAVLLFKRYVDHVTGGRTDGEKPAVSVDAAQEPIDIEPFVE